MPPANKPTVEEYLRAARIYRTNQDVCRALGVDETVFTRACKRHGIETPANRNRRKREEKKHVERPDVAYHPGVARSPGLGGPSCNS